MGNENPIKVIIVVGVASAMVFWAFMFYESISAKMDRVRIPVITEDGSVLDVYIAPMSEKSFEFFESQLKVYRNLIIERHADDEQ